MCRISVLVALPYLVFQGCFIYALIRGEGRWGYRKGSPFIVMACVPLALDYYVLITKRTNKSVTFLSTEICSFTHWYLAPSVIIMASVPLMILCSVTNRGPFYISELAYILIPYPSVIMASVPLIIFMFSYQQNYQKRRCPPPSQPPLLCQNYITDLFQG